VAELWDVYDGSRRKTGKLHERGVPMAEGEYHLVVQIWIINDKGEFLISRRHPDKSYPLCWEATGGAVTAGETSFIGALREVEEELGLKLDPTMGKCVIREKHRNVFADIWLYRSNADLSELHFQETEVVDAKWASPKEIERMCKDGSFVDLSNYRGRIYRMGEALLKKEQK